MRFINIPAFSEGTEITDLTSFYKSRLAGGRSAPCKGGILLLGYMVWPNDTIKRENAVAVIQEWLHHGEPGPLPLGLRTAQQHWARVADIIHLHHDIATGGHQEIRGGASVGKAIYLVSKLASNKGTGEARLWKIWKTYKDVAHLVAAAVIVSADMNERHKQTPLHLTLQKLLPFRVTLLMPELIVGLGMTIQHYGLQDREQVGSLLDMESLWRIPSDVGLAPLSMPPRVLRRADVEILNARRAGNRGRHRQGETTPIL
jgi:hypothetical protein